MNVIYHVAARADWELARREGQYTMSTIGRTLAQEGYIHASRAWQVNDVLSKYYRGVTGDLVVLVIDAERVRAPVRYEQVPEAADLFPHIYGPLNADAVIAVRPLRAGPDGEFTFAPEPTT